MAFLEIQAVRKDFSPPEEGGGAVQAIKDLTLTFAQGGFASLVGPSGCGKSTLLHLIAGLPPYFPPTAGRMVVDGQEIQGPGAERGMVFQEYAVFPWLSVRDNIEYPLALQGVPAAARQERSAYYIELLGLRGFEGAHPHKLSGGMRQRVAVARALINRPKVLLMDEPFAAVDAQTRITMQQELVRVWETERPTVIFVTHSVQEAVFLSDRVIVMTGRPGQVLDDIHIPLGRPRRWRALEADPEFVALQHRITDLIMDSGGASDG